MVVHRPAAIGNDVLEAAAIANFVLAEHVVAHVAPVLALAGELAYELDAPVLVLVLVGSIVLDVVDDAVGDLVEFAADGLGIANGVGESPYLQPPVVIALDAGVARGEVGG
jgi:hypothetical protein